MGNPNQRVEIPRNAEQALGLASKVLARHTALGDASPLNALLSHSWAANGPSVAQALALHQQAEELKRSAEEAFRRRDLLLAEIDQSVKASRDLLLAVYRDNPKCLGEWGFEVNDTLRAKKEAAK